MDGKGENNPQNLGLKTCFFGISGATRWKEKTIFPNYILLNKKNPIREREFEEKIYQSQCHIKNSNPFFHFCSFFLYYVN